MRELSCSFMAFESLMDAHSDLRDSDGSALISNLTSGKIRTEWPN